MPMKTSVGRLYTLFNACLPDNEKVKKRLTISKLLESKEYLELKDYAPFKPLFNKFYSKECLFEYDQNKLEEIKKAIPVLIPTIEKINNAIQYGNGWDLTEDDVPDFTSYNSLNKLSAKIKIDQADKNISNINNFMEIFNKKTIKNPNDVLLSISTEDIKKPEAALKKRLSNDKYCIKQSDINAIKEKYMQQMSVITQQKNGIKHDKRALRWRKLGIIGIMILILVALNSFELLSPNGTGSAMAIMFSILLMILYFIIG